MNTELPDFTPAQWEFLALLEAFEEPVSIDFVATLSPILPGEFLDFQARCLKMGWIQISEDHQVSLAPDLPSKVMDQLKKINSPERVSLCLNRLQSSNLANEASRSVLANLMARSGQIKTAAWLESDQAQEYLGRGDYESALKYLNRSLTRLTPDLGDSDCDVLFVSNMLEFSNLCFVTGRKLDRVALMLEKAREASGRLGDRRSGALINLHLGRLLYFGGRKSEALTALSEGRKEVIDLGDADILTQSSEFFGLYFFAQGLFREAIVHFERAREVYESQAEDPVILPSASVFLGYCAAYLGEFQRAVGSLDFGWRLALERGIRPLASTIRAALGTVLLLMNKRQEAVRHLQESLEEAMEWDSALSIFLSRGGLAYLDYLEGREKESRNMMAEAMDQGAMSGILGHYSSPWVLEMLFAFDQLGFDPVPGLRIEDEVERIHHEPNIHLRGVALRLQARAALTRGVEASQIQSYLEASEDYLKRSGDPVQLGKTRLERARLCLSKGDKEMARLLAQKARQGLSGFTEELYPDDLRHLLESKSADTGGGLDRNDFFQRFMDLLDQLLPDLDLDKTLARTVTASNRFFGAERGALFWFDNKAKTPRLRIGCNMSKGEIARKNFQHNLALINKAFRENSPLVVRRKDPRYEFSEPRAILCIPVVIQGQVRGIVYHDNAYVDDCFDYLDRSQLLQLTAHLSKHVENVWQYCHLKEKRDRQVMEESVIMERHDGLNFLTQHPVMLGILRQADQIATSDAPVLILGETGVGKELLARRLHQASSRRQSPLVIVDATTIPENLVESELFGYEKGAFTGADRRKLGRLELAHQGTLFIDEIGEISKTNQSKLLRALQEKTFTRLGGTRTLDADFRLIVATNRDLAAEVAAGDFRRDLYYRINVMTITIPPLRDRVEDILLLAEHFLMHFVKKHSRPLPRMTFKDKERLASYHWPGNVRELKNVMERSVLLSNGSQLELTLTHDSKSDLSHPFSDTPSLDEVQRRYIHYVLEKTNGKIHGPGGAAELLGIKRTTLYSRIKKLGLNQ